MNHITSVHTRTPNTFKINKCLILPFHRLTCFQTGLFSLGILKQVLCLCRIPAMTVPCPTNLIHPLPFHHQILCFGIQLMCLLVMHLFPVSICFHRITFIYSFWHLGLQTPRDVILSLIWQRKFYAFYIAHSLHAYTTLVQPVHCFNVVTL
jgi:hypothetical protein